MSPSKVPTQPELQALAPEAGQDWSGYWTTVTAMALFLFVLYIAANGLIIQWLKLFVYATPSSVQPSSGGGGGGGGIGGMVQGAAMGALGLGK